MTDFFQKPFTVIEVSCTVNIFLYLIKFGVLMRFPGIAVDAVQKLMPCVFVNSSRLKATTHIIISQTT